jgi:hypothetical protein
MIHDLPKTYDQLGLGIPMQLTKQQYNWWLPLLADSCPNCGNIINFTAPRPSSGFAFKNFICTNMEMVDVWNDKLEDYKKEFECDFKLSAIGYLYRIWQLENYVPETDLKNLYESDESIEAEQQATNEEYL